MKTSSPAIRTRERKASQITANLTVAIATRNRPEAVSMCLRTLLSADVLPAEIIVVDQSSDHQTEKVVEHLQTGDETLKYFHLDTSGLGKAQNFAFEKACFPIVAVTDDDCVPAPDWVARIEASCTSPEPIDALTGRVLPLGPDVPGEYAVSSRRSTERVKFGPRAMPWDIGSGNNFAVKRDWLQRIGGNDERLGPGSPGKGGVDMDLFYRLLRAGARMHYEPDLVVYHARTSKAGRLARRIPYGYGMGAACSFWLRQKDYHAIRVLGTWTLMRLGRLTSGLRQRDWFLAYEELLVLSGTAGGLLHGWRI